MATKTKTLIKPDTPEARREALKKWLERNDLKANTIAKRAGVSVSAIYNFLNGDSKSLSFSVLKKLADAAATTVDSILSGEPGAASKSNLTIKVAYRIGSRGIMFLSDDQLLAAPPMGVPLPEKVLAALIEGDGLAPIPAGWTVFFREEPSDPNTLLNKMAVVRFSGGGDRPCVRIIIPSAFADLHSLRALDGTITDDVKILASHEVVSFGLSQVSRT